MKRIISVILTACLAWLAVVGCSGNIQQTVEPIKTPDTTTAVVAAAEPDATPVIAANTESNPSGAGNPETEKTPSPTRSNTEQTVTGETVMNGVSFVMIYDPYIFDEKNEQKSKLASLFSGDMGSQIVTGLHRAGGLGDDTPEIPGMISQAEINHGLDSSGVERAAGRAGGQDPIYKKGEKHSFFSFDQTLQYRTKQEFDCVYNGTYCYVWSLDGSIGEADAEKVGKEFDEKIYKNDTEFFGTPRFTENGGKVNILFYSLPEGIGGFFCLYDIFSSQEAPSAYAEAYGLNTDHAIITINSKYLKTNLPFLNATLAHELQHLICASEAFYYADSPFVRTWLDEAMSAYAEDLNYPGLKMQNGYNELMYLSDNYRKGQSLYNFETDNDEYIGAYGVVYLFDRYLIKYAGEQIFSDIHTYWKNSYSATVTEADAIYASVPKAFMQRVTDGYVFPEAIAKGFNSEAEEWMSKMTLDFYIETVSLELAELTEYADAAHLFMLYSEINPLYLEGGGRIIVAVENGSFTIPKDSDKGLVFIGFDSDFNVVTDLYTNVQ